MKAIFNKTEYAKSIQEAVRKAGDVGKQPLHSGTFTVADYSGHIRETSGKVLKCSSEWYK